MGTKVGSLIHQYSLDLKLKGGSLMKEMDKFLEKLEVSMTRTEEALRESFLELESRFCEISVMSPLSRSKKASTVGQFLSVGLKSVEENSLVRAVAQTLFLSHMARGCTVVDDEGRLVGIVSVTELAELNTRTDLLNRLGDLKVREIMTNYTVTVEPTATPTEVIHLMLSFRLQRIVVVNREKRPLGVVTTLDLVKALKSRSQMEVALQNLLKAS